MKKQLSLVALGLAGVLALSACSGGNNNPASSSQAPAQIRVWLVGPDTPQTARDYLKTTFEAQNPGSTLVIEEQSWTGLVDKYTTALSGSDAPDVVEIGNTQAPAFTSAGAFLDLTDKYTELGGDDLLPGFVEFGSYDGKFYAAPYYAGARVGTYSTDFVSAAPTTWQQFLDSAKAMTTDKVSGLWMPGMDWRDLLTFVWVNGGDIATQGSDGKWTAGFETPEAIKGLQQMQDMFTTANHAPTDADDTYDAVAQAFCSGQVGYMMFASWIGGFVEGAPADGGCSDTYGAADKVHQFAIPGLTAGSYAPVLAGGSNIAIPAKSSNPDLAYKALQIMLSDDYQKLLADTGMVPAKVSQAKFLPTSEGSQAAANAASQAKGTPTSPKWADVEGQRLMEDAFSRIAQGQDVTQVAKDLDNSINSILNA